MTNALDIYRPETYETMKLVAGSMAASGYFQDAQQHAQAIVKVLAGAELGVGPFASITGIHIIQGRPAISANLLASLIKNDPRYDYRVMRMFDTDVSIEFYEDGEMIGVSTFTAEDAQRANTKNMAKYPRNMLFARAMSNGAKWYCPGIFGGAPVYTPEELGAETDEEGNVIEGEVIQRPPEPDPVADANEMFFGDNGEPEPETPEPDETAQVKEQVIEALDEEDDIDHFAAALEATDLAAFAGHAAEALDGYDDNYHVVGAMTKKWPEAHEQKSFRFTPSKTAEYLQWLADRKAEEA